MPDQPHAPGSGEGRTGSNRTWAEIVDPRALFDQMRAEWARDAEAVKARAPTMACALARVVELEAQVAELGRERDEALAAIEKMVGWMRETNGTVSWISHGEKLLARAAERGVS